MTEWQPISTAPRDGTEILVYGENDCDGCYQRVAYFDDEHQMFMKKWRTTVGHSYLTHWIPLPEPPKDGRG